MDKEEVGWTGSMNISSLNRLLLVSYKISKEATDVRREGVSRAGQSFELCLFSPPLASPSSKSGDVDIDVVVDGVRLF